MLDRYFTNYKRNQYEDIDRSKFLYGQEIKARYTEQEEPTYKDNQLIEALPPIMGTEELYDEMEEIPFYAEEERKRSKEYRMHAIYRLENYILPMSIHDEIGQKISIALRRGYVNRGIAPTEYMSKLRFTSELLKDSSKLNELKEILSVTTNNVPATSGFSIIGISGGGKSTAVNRILALYPQNILHIYQGEDKLIFKQLSWLKIDCTYNGSLKGICQKFFSAVDHVLGTKYLNQFGKLGLSIDKMIISMAHVAQKHALGLLVIDEIQHLKSAQHGGEGALNFFVTMMNEIKLPILYIGTYKMVDTILGKEFRQARRASGSGTINWNFMEKDVEWDYFIERLWKYQWTKENTVLTDEIKNIMYEKTMGITDRIIKLYMAVQMEAIMTGDEKITPSIIESVADQKFALTKKAIDALRSGDPYRLAEFDDMRAPNIEEIYEHSVEKINRQKELIEIIENEGRMEKRKKREIINEIIYSMEGSGYKGDEVIRITEDVVEKYLGKKEIGLMTIEVYKKVIKEEHIKQNKKKKPSKEHNNVSIDVNVDVKDILDGLH